MILLSVVEELGNEKYKLIAGDTLILLYLFSCNLTMNVALNSCNKILHPTNINEMHFLFIFFIYISHLQQNKQSSKKFVDNNEFIILSLV